MADVTMSRVILYKPQMDMMLKQPQGEVGRYLHVRGRAIQAAARAQVGVRTGALRASIMISQERAIGGQKMKVGSSLPYALMHHEGTRPRVINARPGGMLRFTRGARVVYTRQVMHPGTRPNKFLSDNLYLALV
jgi:hypothetical protein